MSLYLVCGDRHWVDGSLIRRTLAELPSGSGIIHGGCTGADELAWRSAIDLGLDIIVIKAQWERYGRSAGPRRNCQMLDLKPVEVIAFHDNLSNSKGTKHCVSEANRRGIPVRLVTHG